MPDKTQPDASTPKKLKVIPYASNTGSSRNLAALKASGWRLLLTPDNPLQREGFKYAVDNGAWSYFQKQIPFDEDRFKRLVDAVGPQADFVILPDIVAGGMASLDFSMKWVLPLYTLRSLMLPLQDGMRPEDIGPVLREWSKIGLFLGGSTEWKLQTMQEWGAVAASWDRPFHVGRVNTARRIRQCSQAGATSFDGTSATRFSCTLPLLDGAIESARKQPSLFNPRCQ